ncbi:hypothetical protein RclHR1_25850001 [Rhizophagus clarus]|uniref:Extracellular serine-rich protein n=1 Tax=Rhizophagus clarus TaxID=94130 RepID=A0A2Z6RFC2_9GLOM|nr:hypothetical protein RclHR1_25850001 [Rhizophagus clarus]GES98823.1 extracellular serine-rich protein [Rhizophagus clarus]
MSKIPVVYLFLLGVIAYVHAANINVVVGGPNGENIFNPQTVSANIGDNIIFTWISGKHSIIESDAAGSCAKSIKSDAFSSSDAFTAPKVLNLSVNNVGKTWFYCGVPGHCANGMYGTLIVNGNPSSIAFPVPNPVTGSPIPGKKAPSDTATPSNGAGPTVVNSPNTSNTPIMVGAIVGALISGDFRNNKNVLLIPASNDNSRGNSTEVYSHRQGANYGQEANHEHETNHGREANQETSHEKEASQETNHEKEADYHGQEVISISENHNDNNLQ